MLETLLKCGAICLLLFQMTLARPTEDTKNDSGEENQPDQYQHPPPWNQGFAYGDTKTNRTGSSSGWSSSYSESSDGKWGYYGPPPGWGHNNGQPPHGHHYQGPPPGQYQQQRPPPNQNQGKGKQQQQQQKQKSPDKKPDKNTPPPNSDEEAKNKDDDKEKEEKIQGRLG